jgi:uncharacterized membrane protein
VNNKNTKTYTIKLGLVGGAIFAIFLVIVFTLMAGAIVTFLAVMGVAVLLLTIYEFCKKKLYKRKPAYAHRAPGRPYRSH